MKQLEPHKLLVGDKPEIHAVKPISKQKIIVSIPIQRGHKAWEFNLVTKIIREAEYKETKAELVEQKNIFTGKVNGLVPKTTNDVIEKEGCIYCSALNVQNADKKFAKMLRIPYPKNKKPQQI